MESIKKKDVKISKLRLKNDKINRGTKLKSVKVKKSNDDTVTDKTLNEKEVHNDKLDYTTVTRSARVVRPPKVYDPSS